MATLIKFTVKDVPVEFDLEKLTPEVQIKMLTKGCARSFFERETGKGDKSSLEMIQAAAVKVSTDPNTYYLAVGHRGEGVSRPKLDMYEKKARSWFKDEFVIHLKNSVPQVIAVWEANGGSGLLLKATEKMTAEQKTAVERNLVAKNKIIEKRTVVERKKAEKAGAKIDLNLGE